VATQVIGARAAAATEARILHEKRGAALLTMTRTAWDAGGQILEYAATCTARAATASN
jgi:DNA-binding GntR family transcriptional regulator